MGTFLTNTSIGRKVVMSLSGAFLVLFITFHMAMNLAALVSADAYNAICAFLGANWYALVATAVLALGVVVHFAYAFILTFQNRKARGNVRYAVTDSHKGVDWASQNMLVLGIIVIGGLAIHLIHFWSKMQLQELMGAHEVVLADGTVIEPTSGYELIKYTFSNIWNVVIYVVWLAALWFHLSHGIWSMFQSMGWANQTWYPRLKCLATAWTTLIVLGFMAVAIAFYVKNTCPCCADEPACDTTEVVCDAPACTDCPQAEECTKACPQVEKCAECPNAEKCAECPQAEECTKTCPKAEECTKACTK